MSEVCLTMCRVVVRQCEKRTSQKKNWSRRLKSELISRKHMEEALSFALGNTG